MALKWWTPHLRNTGACVPAWSAYRQIWNDLYSGDRKSVCVCMWAHFASTCECYFYCNVTSSPGLEYFGCILTCRSNGSFHLTHFQPLVYCHWTLDVFQGIHTQNLLESCFGRAFCSSKMESRNPSLLMGPFSEYKMSQCLNRVFFWN